jgi:hypothetical protein
VTAPAALLELHARVSASRDADAMRMALLSRLKGRLFDKQLAFIDDAAKNKAAQCTRRAGKTTGTAVDEVVAPLQLPGSRALYATLTRERAKDLLWPELRRLDFEEQIGAKFNEVELTMTLPEGLGSGSVKLTGADKAKEIHKQRGSKYRRVRVDEAQAFGLYLKEFIEDVIEPTLMDQEGDVGLLGTPGVVCAGYYHDVCVGQVKGWSVHRWSVLDNPFMPHAREWIEQKRKERHWDETHPTYLREWCGQWVNDSGALVYK